MVSCRRRSEDVSHQGTGTKHGPSPTLLYSSSISILEKERKEIAPRKNPRVHYNEVAYDHRNTPGVGG